MWNVKIKLIIHKIIAICKVKALPRNYYKPLNHEKQSKGYWKLSSWTQKKTQISKMEENAEKKVLVFTYVFLQLVFTYIVPNCKLHLSWLNRTMININLKGCVCYIFTSLFCMSKREHFWRKEKCFLFHFKNSFRPWDSQILTFQVFKCHHVIKYLRMKRETHFTE